MRLQVLGGFRLWDTASGSDLPSPPKKSRALLAHLALSRAGAVSREKMAALLWPESAEEQARASVRQALAGLRRLFADAPSPLLSTGAGDVALARHQLAVDALEFDALARSTCVEDLARAATLYAGPLLDGLDVRADPFDAWLSAERARLHGRMVHTLTALVEAYTRQGALGAALSSAQQLVAHAPLREDAHRAVMRLHLQQREFGEALAQYATCERLLQAELGVAPETETVALRDQVLHERAAPVGDSDPPRDEGKPTLAPERPRRLAFAPPRDEGKPTIAVLPFENLDDDRDHERFADGLTEDITTELSRFPELFVIARNTAFAYKRRQGTAEEVGRELAVEYLVTGRVRRAGTRLRLTAQLVNARDGRQVWAQRYDRELRDVFDLQDDLTRGIVSVLPGRVRDVEARRIARKPPEDMAAYELLVAGRLHHHRFTGDDNRRAIELLDQAIERDPVYAAAWAWKACVLGQAVARAFVSDLERVWDDGVACAQRALELDNNDIECHRILCEIAITHNDLDTAERHNRRALDLNPNDPRLHAQQGELLVWRGQPRPAAEAVRRAMRLDPYGAADWSHQLARALLHMDDYAGAIAAYETSTYPRYAHHADMAGCYAQLGEHERAQAMVARVLQAKPDFAWRPHLAKLPYSSAEARERHGRLLAGASLP